MGERLSLVDFNRSGVPLMEIVTEPDIRTAEQARRYAEELQLLLRTIGASDADMERGQLRVEANISLRPRGTEAFGTRVEVKNMNSFRSVERAVAFEIERQAAALDAGEPLRMETRGWADDRGETYHMRSKETSDDYRYFPEPDLPPLRVDAAWLAQIRGELPELPAARRTRYQDALGLSAVRRRRARRPMPTPAACSRRRSPPRRASRPSPSRTGSPATTSASGTPPRTAPIRVEPAQLAALVRLVADGSINRSSGRDVLEAHAATGEAVEASSPGSGSPDLRCGRARGHRRRGPGGEPVGRCRRPRRQAARRSGSSSAR